MNADGTPSDTILLHMPRLATDRPSWRACGEEEGEIRVGVVGTPWGTPSSPQRERERERERERGLQQAQIVGGGGKKGSGVSE